MASDRTEAEDIAYWEAVVEKSIHDAVVRKAEAAAHEERLARILAGRDPIGWLPDTIMVTREMLADAPSFQQLIHTSLAGRQVILNAGDTLTIKTGALRMTSD